jgi:hypothetical protein
MHAMCQPLEHLSHTTHQHMGCSTSRPTQHTPQAGRYHCQTTCCYIQHRRCNLLQIDIVPHMEPTNRWSITSTLDSCIPQCILVLSNGKVLKCYWHKFSKKLCMLRTHPQPHFWVIKVRHLARLTTNRCWQVWISTVQ